MPSSLRAYNISKFSFLTDATLRVFDPPALVAEALDDVPVIAAMRGDDGAEDAGVDIVDEVVDDAGGMGCCCCCCCEADAGLRPFVDFVRIGEVVGVRSGGGWGGT